MIRKASQSGRSSGFSMLELVVVVLIVFLAFLVASRLMVLAQRRSVVEQRRLLDPAVALALHQLKADFKGALSAAGQSEEGEPLTLVQPSGVVVTYEVRGDEVNRKLSDPPGERLFLSGVRKFEWAWVENEPGKIHLKPMMQIDVEYETTLLSGAITVDDQHSRVPRGLESRSLMLTLRGNGGVGW